MRLFIALPVTEDARSRITDATAGGFGHPEWQRTHPATWHVTLAFLGDVAGDRRDEVEEVLRTATRPVGPVALSVAEVDTVARRMVWLRLDDEPAGAAAELGAAIQDGLAGADLPVDQREVTPHITLARWRGGGGRAPRGDEPDLPAVDVTWRVDRAVLYRSDLGEDRAHHEPLAEAGLDGA